MKPITATENHLLQTYGPLMTLDQLATMLNRSVGGVRLGLRTSAPWAIKLQSARRKVGRRVYFRTTAVASFIDDAE